MNCLPCSPLTFNYDGMLQIEKPSTNANIIIDELLPLVVIKCQLHKLPTRKYSYINVDSVVVWSWGTENRVAKKQVGPSNVCWPTMTFKVRELVQLYCPSKMVMLYWIDVAILGC